MVVHQFPVLEGEGSDRGPRGRLDVVVYHELLRDLSKVVLRDVPVAHRFDPDREDVGVPTTASVAVEGLVPVPRPPCRVQSPLTVKVTRPSSPQSLPGPKPFPVPDCPPPRHSLSSQ